MKKLLFITSIIASLLCTTTLFAKNNGQSLDQMVAIVNDDVITQSELNHAMATAKAQIRQENTTAPSEKVLSKQVLDQLINKKVQMQMAKSMGININDAEVNKTIARIAQQNHLSMKDLFDRLHDEGMNTADYKREIREQITLHQLQQHEVAGKINVSAQEISSFMRSHAWQINSTKEYHLQDILVPLSEAPSMTEITSAKQQADNALMRAKHGESFDVIAQSSAANTPALQGGDLGWRKLPEIPSAFAAQVVNMHTAQVIGPIQTANGFHILRLAEMRTTAADNSAKPTRKNVEAILLQQKFEEAVQQWVSKLRSQAFIVTNS